LQTLVNPSCDASRDGSANGINVLASNRLPGGSGDYVVAESEGLVEDLSRTRVFAGKRCHENSISAVGIELCVKGSLVEWNHVEQSDIIADGPSIALAIKHPVLWNHFRSKAALNYHLQFR
jgi:hypothetical protein